MNDPVFTISAPNGKSYNVARASAVSQKTLLLLLGKQITIASLQPAAPEDAIKSPEFLVGTLLTLKEADFDKVASLSLPKIFETGDDRPLSIADFQDDIMSYLHVLSSAIRENLQGFFLWLLEQKKQEQKPSAKMEEMKSII